MITWAWIFSNSEIPKDRRGWALKAGLFLVWQLARGVGFLGCLLFCSVLWSMAWVRILEDGEPTRWLSAFSIGAFLAMLIGLLRFFYPGFFRVASWRALWRLMRKGQNDEAD